MKLLCMLDIKSKEIFWICQTLSKFALNLLGTFKIIRIKLLSSMSPHVHNVHLDKTILYVFPLFYRQFFILWYILHFFTAIGLKEVCYKHMPILNCQVKWGMAVFVFRILFLNISKYQLTNF